MLKTIDEIEKRLKIHINQKQYSTKEIITQMTKSNNTMSVSFLYFDKQRKVLSPNRKDYILHIPKALRDGIKPDVKHAVIGIKGLNYIQIVAVNRIYREEVEETGRIYRTISDFQEVTL